MTLLGRDPEPHSHAGISDQLPFQVLAESTDLQLRIPAGSQVWGRGTPRWWDLLHTLVTGDLEEEVPSP